MRWLHAARLEGGVDTEGNAILLWVKMKRHDSQGESQLPRVTASPKAAANSFRAM